jgi:hypothetical protein
MQIGIDSFAAAISDPATGLTLSPVERMHHLLGGWHTLWDWSELSGGASFTLSVKVRFFGCGAIWNFFTCNFTCKDSFLAVSSRTSAVPDAIQAVGSTCSRPFDTVEVCGSLRQTQGKRVRTGLPLHCDGLNHVFATLFMAIPYRSLYR